MKDPVNDRDGNSYERAAIEAWVVARGTSPITRNPLSIRDLVPNRALRQTIDDYMATLPASPRSVLTSMVTGVFSGPAQPVMPPLGMEITSTHYAEDTYVEFAITSHETERVPSRIVLGIDVSGSMVSMAKTQGAGDEMSSFSLLDLVKQAANHRLPIERKAEA